MPVITHSRPSLGLPEFRSVWAVLQSHQLGAGPWVRRFERAFAAHLGLRGAVAVSSGTAALHLALLALGIRPGDEVLIPSFACVAVWQAVRVAGAVPRLVDVEPDTFNLCPVDLRRRVTPRSRAVIVTHAFGFPADVRAIGRVGVPLVEDCAQALGATDHGRPVGTVGRVAVCSFYATKMIATGEGGMLVSQDAAVLARARDLRAYHDKSPDRVRYNYRMSDLAAALGVAQLGRLPQFIARRRALAARYRRAWRGLPVAHPVVAPSTAPVFYRYVVRVREGRVDRVVAAAAARGVTCARPVPVPLHRAFGIAGYAGAEAAWCRAVSVPIYPALEEPEVGRVLAVMQAVLRRVA